VQKHALSSTARIVKIGVAVLYNALARFKKGRHPPLFSGIQGKAWNYRLPENNTAAAVHGFKGSRFRGSGCTENLSQSDHLR
jgi:hypothetical protein